MSKKYSIFITALFCAFIFGFGAAHFILPDRDFSEQENRYLSQFKAPTLETVRTGRFMEDFENYVTDQFPLRDRWIRLKALSERALGKQENNKVYFGKDWQTLFAQFTAPSQEELEKRLGFVNALGENLDALDVPVYFSLVPDKSYAYPHNLPANAPNVDDGSTIRWTDVRCGANVKSLDLTWRLGDLCWFGQDAGDGMVALDEHSDFYRTDHHWTTVGAYGAYLSLMEQMGLDAAADFGRDWLDRLTPVSGSFYGTTYSAAGAGWVRPDTICVMIPEGGLKGRVTVTRYPEGDPVESTMYHPDKLEVKDKYAYFLGGNQPLCVIRNPDAPDGRLLVVRDSYADTLAPFLAEQFREVHLFDLRYNNTSVKQYVEDNGIDRVLVLYSVANFSTDINLFKMAH